jgi:hypothetical protein
MMQKRSVASGFLLHASPLPGDEDQPPRVQAEGLPLEVAEGLEFREARLAEEAAQFPHGVEADRAVGAPPAVLSDEGPIRFDAPGLSYALVGRLANLRTRIDKTAYGDQGIFVCRRAFEQVGGYPEVVLCEDVLLMRRLRSAGAYVFLSSPTMVTSARRLQRRGVMRNALVNLVIRTGLSLGVSPQRLKCLYPEHGVAEAGEGR